MAAKYLQTGGGSVVWTASNTAIWSDSDGGPTGAAVPVDGDTVNMTALSGGGTVTLGYSPTVTSITMGAFTGTFDASTFSPTMDTFNCSGTGTRTLTLGSGTWTIRGNAATVWNTGTSTNLTLNVGTSTVRLTYSGSTGTRTLSNGSGVAVFNNLSVSAGSDTVVHTTTGPSVKNMDYTGFSGTTSATNAINFSGNLTFGAGMTVPTGSGNFTANGTSGTQTITSNGVTASNIVINGVGASVVLADNLSIDTARALTLTNGTFNANGFNVTCGSFSSSNSNVRTLTMSTGTWTLTGTGTVWNTGTTTNLTASQASSSIVISDASASAKTFTAGGSGGAETFGNVTVSPGGSGAVTFNNSTTRTYASFNATGPKSIVLTASSAYSTPILNVTGSAGNLVTFTSTIPGTQYSFSVASGDVYARYVSLQDSNATGGARFFALNSTNVSNNTGWRFVASRTAASGRFNIRDQHAAISFDGSTSFLVKASPTGINNGTNGSVTFAGWIKLRGSAIATVAELHVNGTASPAFVMGQSGGLYYVFSDRVNALNNKTITTADFSQYVGLERWVFLTYVLTSTTITVYAGTTAILPTNALGAAINVGTVSSLFFGKGQTTGQVDQQFLNAILKDWRVYNGALTATEVSNLYYSELNASTLSGAWNMDAGAGSSVADGVGSNTLTATGITWTADRPFAARKRDDGNLVKNGDFEFAPPFVAAQTAGSAFLNGSASGSATSDLFGWAIQGITGSVSARFDSSVSHGGSYSLKISTVGTGAIIPAGLSVDNAVPNLLRYAPRLLPNTSYKATFWMKTNYVSGDSNDGANLQFVERNASASAVANNPSTLVKTTTDWTQYTVNFTTSANAAYLSPKPLITGSTGAGTLIMDAWYDDIVVTATTPQVRTLATNRYRLE